jgi:Rieske Fe-S protein
MHEHLLPLKPLTLEEVQQKGAAVGKLEGKKVAAYKDGTEVKAVSALCTHKFCIVQPEFENPEADSGKPEADSVKPGAALAWHCPCHGARFELNGKVISGPAEAPLSKVDVKIEDGKIVLERSSPNSVSR